jgi:hypothetical protein
MVWVIKRTDVPRKAKVKRKLQNNRVPSMDTENMEIEVA